MVDLPITKAIHERLFAVIPLIVLVATRIPHYLVHDLRDSNGMRAGTRGGSKAPTVRVSDVTLVVRTIEVLAVPAARKDNSCANALGTVLCRQLTRVFSITWCKALAIAETAVADGHTVVSLGHGIASEHAETWFEGGQFVVFGTVGHVVHCHAATLLDPDIGHLWNSLVCAVFWGLEVERCGPVVAEVL